MTSRAEYAVFFDVGGTLMYSNPPVPVVFAEVARRFGYSFEISEVEPWMDEAVCHYAREYERDGDFWCDNDRAAQVWKDMYALMARGLGIVDESVVESLSQQIYDEYLDPSCWSLFDEVPECLETLETAGYRLGVISNWDCSLESILSGLGCLDKFDVVIASANVGRRKPHPEVFELALRRMGVEACNAFHVGDTLEADGAARNVGMCPIMIDRYGWIGDTDLPCMKTLSELPDLLEALIAKRNGKA